MYVSESAFSEDKLNQFFLGKKCLVLGGSGFIGSNLATKLLRLEAKVTVTYFSNKPHVQSPGILIEHCDATNLESLLGILDGFEYVFIACAITSGSAVIRNSPFVHLSDNLVMNTRILEACDRVGVKKILFISSSTVYPNSPETMTEDIETGEFFPAYEIVATMKQASERIALLYAAHSKNKMEVVITRPSNSYGPGDDFDPITSKVLPALVRKFSQKILPIEVWGDGKDIKDFVYIDDLVDGIARVMAFGGNGAIYNIASGIDSTVGQAVEILGRECSVLMDSVEYKTEIPSMIPIRRISIEKSRTELGYAPKIELRLGLAKTLEWFQKENQIIDCN